MIEDTFRRAFWIDRRRTNVSGGARADAASAAPRLWGSRCFQACSEWWISILDYVFFADLLFMVVGVRLLL